MVTPEQGSMGETAPEGQSFPFTRLPPDIQYNVCQSLCGHCTNAGEPLAILDHEPDEGTKALRNLCLVSRDLCAASQGILYHFPRIYSYTDFFRTLKARPDLSNSVKVQRCIYKDETERQPESRREDIWYLRRLAADLGLDDTDPAAVKAIYTYYHDRDERDVFGDGRYSVGMAFDSFATALTLSLCSRLEFLTLNLNDTEL